MHSSSRFALSTFATVMFTVALISNAPVSGTAVEPANDPLQISNEEVKNSYLQYVKLISQGQGQGASGPDCQPGLGQLESEDLLSDNALCNPGLENQQDKLTNEQLDQDIINKLSDNVEDKAAILKDKLEKLRERMEKAISEEEEEGIILPEDVRKKIDADDIKAIEGHKSKEGAELEMVMFWTALQIQRT
ncbi:MAG TPA: hypothetical protein VE548_15145 [Nitrososphaeraceae archaeon]|nr:hypothetical protein [Nitrososphaeraceae archaeon]